MTESQKKRIEGATVVEYDRKNNVVLAFFGGMVIRGYDPDGYQVAYWQLPTWTTGQSYPSTAHGSMLKAISSGNYPSY